MLTANVVLVALLALIGGQLCIAVDIDTEHGPVRGETIPVTLASGDFNVHRFWGIPYARAPVGDLRFEVGYVLYYLGI